MFHEMIGIWLIVIGAILAVFALAGRLPGKKNVGTVVAVGILVAGLVLAGPFLSGLLSVAPNGDGDIFGGAVYEVTFLDTTPWSANLPTGASQIVNPAFTVLDILANDTNWAALTSTASAIDFIVSRTDAGDADDTQIYYLDIGSVDTITDSSAGTTYTLIDFSDTTESFDWDFTETSGSDNTPGLVLKDREFVAGQPGERHDLTVTFDINEAAFGSSNPSVVGASYTFGIVAAGSVLIVNMVVSAA